jgi:hypothetical protein
MFSPVFAGNSGKQFHAGHMLPGNIYPSGSVFDKIVSGDDNALKTVVSTPAKETEFNATSSKSERSQGLIIENEIGADFGPGPSQPEMTSFKSINSNNMVDLFTGDFSYNIPLLDVGGYPVNLHYNSGITMDQEASWVGLGWNINPGTINRNMRGLPDDFNGSDSITKVFTMKPNKTIGLTIGGNAELFGKTKINAQPSNLSDSTKGRASSLGISLGIFHNNYNGWGIETSINAGINSGSGSKGPLSGGLSLSNNSQSGLDVSPSFSVRMGVADSKLKGLSATLGTNYNSRMGVQGLQLNLQTRVNVKQVKDEMDRARGFSTDNGLNAEISFATPSFTPTISAPFSSRQYSFTVKVGSEKWAYHPNLYVQGNYSLQEIEKEDQVSQLPAYGYLYYQQAEGAENVLLDFNREKEVAFRGKTPHIAIPGYTYDIYSVSGEGTGGMFRPYRGDVGMIYDHSLSTKSKSDKHSLDLGFGKILHAGIDLNKVYASTTNAPWRNDNIMASYIGFKNADSLYENVYFKNPGEKVSVDQSFYNKIGDDKLVRVELSPLLGSNSSAVSATRNLSIFQNAKKIGTTVIGKDSFKKNRDKRTQVINYLTAADATIVGMDKDIKSFNINSFPSTSCNTNYSIIKRVDGYIRKQHHLSEISVLGSDGKRYIYGIPAYNIEQQDVTFAVDKAGGDNVAGLVTYDTGVDNTVKNKKGKDNFFNQERIPAYAHSFLLSGIVSPDYVDLTNDGISEDDNGDAVKFNYSRIYGTVNPYRWRAPFDQNKAAYNEGFKTYDRDDKGSYTYGEKEVWLMNSIESKTMIATFVLETDTVRKDSYGVKDVNGGRSATQKMYRLKQINLYTKADFLKNGAANAKPIKSVHFAYSYELCPGVPSSDNTGKLTLKKVWFSYNKNYKGQLNPYIFTYNSDTTSFNNKSYDRWGNYKNADNNPGAPGNKLTNAEYPYTLQDGVGTWNSDSAAKYAAPWTLKEIKLPSGGVMKITYESDDYGYVQNRRAMQMFSIEGFGSDSTSSAVPKLYPTSEKKNDHRFVFIRVKNAIASKAELEARYLQGISKLYFKLFVKMPDGKDAGRWGTGYEQIPCFAEIDGKEYGVKPGGDNKTIWIKIKEVKLNSGRSPMATAAIQYLRLNHPGKAYPFSEPGDDIKIKDALGMIGSIVPNLRNSIDGFEDQARAKNQCNDIISEKSLVRLNNPDLKKFGGGLRVKKVEMFDNWQVMTTQQQATYGQTYDYSTTQLVNGVEATISSGVSSYEPALGREENPFYQPIEYAEKMAALGPTDYVFTEEPLGESFFPSPTVGYSKVTVQTINKTKQSANGIDVSEFYTSLDFPTIFENTPLDDESKKTFANPIGNIFKFDSKRYVTLSQGFRVELNDMHGKEKAQHSFAQTDLTKPFRSTYSYYKLDNDFAANKHLSNNVSTIDSTNGRINTAAVMGKDVDILIDIRQQTSKTVSGSVQLNIDFIKWWPPIIIPSIPRLPTFETNRYRSIAVTKVVNRYAILDSVVHIDKGSKISTANMVYDGETGNVLLSRTQNEFDDPVYSFNYPAYWAYPGMGSAYRNIGGIFKDAVILNGKMEYKGMSPLALTRYFESGDEVLLKGKVAKTTTNPSCDNINYNDSPLVAIKIWAMDMGKANPSTPGIYFIDKDGIPVSAMANSMMIIRSGKRNMLGASAGSVTSLQSPVKIVSGVPRIVIDSTIDVIAANAAGYKDFWKVDSSSYRKDTTILTSQLISPRDTILTPIDIKGIRAYKRAFGQVNYILDPNPANFTSLTSGNGAGFTAQERYKSSIIFTPPGYLAGAKITNAQLFLSSPKTEIQLWGRTGTTPSDADNTAYISRPTGLAMQDYLAIVGTAKPYMENAYLNAGPMVVDPNRITVNPTAAFGTSANQSFLSDNISVLVDGMFNDYFSSLRVKRPSFVIDQKYNLTNGTGRNEMGFGYLTCVGDKYRATAPAATNLNCLPKLFISFVPQCENGSAAYYSATPVPGYYCNSQPKDTFVCKPNIADSAVNPYRWGIWGNWRSDKAYTYYNLRKEIDPDVATNIRKDGQIKSFMPYWSFGTGLIQPSIDSSRWVWNTETNLVNSKGLELENKDALFRYNSAHYGYNQTLPIAVAQNSKYREMMFDGFEDYNYKTDTCKSCPDNRFINLVKGGVLVDSVSHTGLYSLRVAGNQTDSATVQIATAESDTLSAQVLGTVSNTNVVRTVITGKGLGLDGHYSVRGLFGDDRVDSTINFDWGEGKIYGNFRDNVNIAWTGWIQPKYSELYTFFASADEFMKVWINGVRISANTIVETHNTISEPMQSIFLNAGQLYTVKVEFTENRYAAKAILEWQSASQRKEVVPKKQLYNFTDTTGTTLTTTVVCHKLDGVQPYKVTHNRFSPIQESKLIVGAWVKEKNNNADTVTNLRNVQMQLAFNNGTTITLKPSGFIIEGWQRIEDTVNVPGDATAMTIRLMSTNTGVPVYFDDVRIHPYNSNLKSFVYNPINIRLMAELDENNFASFYEYDDDGTLIRVKKETERGIKTIKETRSALLKD